MAQLATSTAPQPSRRSTRQQSREAESIPPSSPTKGRKPARSARSASASASLENTSIDPHLNAQRSQANNLQAVPEESQEQSEDANTVFVNHNLHVPQSPGDHSTYSGATAVTSHSQTEVELLQSDGRASEFPTAVVDLCSRANSIIHMLAPKLVNQQVVTTITNELQKPGSSLARFLNSRGEKLNESFALFTNEHYITPKFVLQAAFNTKSDIHGPNTWRPDGMFQKANLAKLACQIVPETERNGVALVGLMQIDNIFPRPFIESFAAPATPLKSIPAGQSKLKLQTFAIALEIRTQLALARFEFGASASQSHTYDPDDILRQNFMAQQAYENDPAHAESWAIPFGGKNLPLTQQMSDAVVKRVRDIRARWNNEDDQPDFELLENTYPWGAFKQQLIEWIRARNDEIEQGIITNKGIDEIAARWENEVAQRANEPAGAPFVAAEPEGIRYLNKRKKARKPAKGSDEFVPQANEQDDIELPTDRPRGVVNHNIPVDPQLHHDRQLAAQRVAQGQPSRGRSMIDSQPGATKVVFEDSQPSQTPRSSMKRRRDISDIGDEEASQDVGFQTDERGPDPNDQRRAAVQVVNNQLVNQAQQAERQRQDEEQQLGRQLGQELGQHYQEPVDESQMQLQSDDDGPPMTQGDLYRTQVQPAAKQLTALRSARHAPQLRKPWTIAEVDQLLRLIEEHGCAYSFMKKEDEKQGNILGENERDAESMRHKARNMKFDYIKSGIPLPPGFEHVLLDKKFKDRLEALGVTYVQPRARRRKGNSVQVPEDAEA